MLAVESADMNAEAEAYLFDSVPEAGYWDDECEQANIHADIFRFELAGSMRECFLVLREWRFNPEVAASLTSEDIAFRNNLLLGTLALSRLLRTPEFTPPPDSTLSVKNPAYDVGHDFVDPAKPRIHLSVNKAQTALNAVAPNSEGWYTHDSGILVHWQHGAKPTDEFVLELFSDTEHGFDYNFATVTPYLPTRLS